MIDERQRTRLGMLAVASVLMGGGVYGWMWWNGQKAAEAEMNASVPTAAVRLRTPKINSEGQTEANALSQSAGENTGVSKPVNTAATVSVQPGSATTNGATPNATTPNATTPNATAPVTRIAVSGQNVIAAKVEPIAAAPTVKPANSLTNNNAIKTAFKPAVNSAPPASITAGIRPPVTPANGAPLRPVQVASAITPTPVANMGRPGAPIAPENMPAVSVPPAAGAIKAITTVEAASVAKLGMGRKDPMQPIAALLPFPRVAQATGSTNLVPPPPNEAEASGESKSKFVTVASKIKEKLVPPPPPTAESNYPGGDNALGGLPIEQLPVPPSKPMIGDKLRVVCVMDDKAIVSFPTDIRAKNKWPKTITLATGEQFDSIRVISITADGVTIEEDGERTLRPVSHIK